MKVRCTKGNTLAARHELWHIRSASGSLTEDPVMSDTQTYFSPALFKYLRELKANNQREWFQDNKSRYEDQIKEPALQFIAAFSRPLSRISSEFQAVPKAVGGSLFRIYRDVRFSKDKTPYKTHVGIHFRHRQHKDAHAPGFYLHLADEGCFVGAGIWRPQPAEARKIRAGIAARATEWKRSTSGNFKNHFAFSGDSLVRPPKGFDADHVLIEDLKRKDFIGIASVSKKLVTSKTLLEEFAQLCVAAKPVVRSLCRSLDLPF